MGRRRSAKSANKTYDEIWAHSKTKKGKSALLGWDN